MSYDETKFETVISHLSAFNPAYAEAPTDAQIVPGDTQFQIQKESEGRELDNEKALKLIQEGIKTGVTEIDFEDSECYKKPSVYENDQNLKEQLEKVNGYLKAKITYDFEDRTIEVTAQDIMAMIAQDDKGNYGLDQTKVKEFVTTKLAYATDTFGLTHTVKCHDGKTRKLTGGDSAGASTEIRPRRSSSPCWSPEPRRRSNRSTCTAPSPVPRTTLAVPMWRSASTTSICGAIKTTSW